LRRLRFL